jgi:hypothetical protein
MEGDDDWLASNNKSKKGTRIGNGELLSYAGNNYPKPIDEERLVKKSREGKNLTIGN